MLTPSHMDNFQQSEFDIQNTDMSWAKEKMVDFASPEYLLNPSLQSCFLPDDLAWLDNFQLHPHPLDSLSWIASTPEKGASDSQPRLTQAPPSILSRPSSPPATHRESGTFVTATSSVKQQVNPISKTRRDTMQVDVHSFYPENVLPSAATLSSFIRRYFKSFHQHQPFLHEPTWSPDKAPTPLILAICANGALYSLERAVAVDLHRIAVTMIDKEDADIWVLQSLMLLMAFSAWGGSPTDLRTALHLHGRATLALRKSWSNKVKEDMSTTGWEIWREEESRKRITYCLFTLMALMHIAYDIPSTIVLEDQHGMPCYESQWWASTSETWAEISGNIPPRQWTSAEAVIQRLGDETLPTPSNIGMFGCHVIIMTLLQKIVQFRRPCSSEDFGFSVVRQHFFQALKRWQRMWESEPEASLSPDHPHGPILFNCTAILRVAYIRLVADFSPIRATFVFSSTTDQIEEKVVGLKSLIRGSQTTRAALQACLALRIPVGLGFKVVARTSFWVWSVQHALCYFECALLLANWLKLVQDQDDLSDDEKGVINLVDEVLCASQGEDYDSSDSTGKAFPAAVLRSWARLLDTGDTTVWGIMPKMAEVLRLYATRLQPS
ncbi:fungal-specific transcription factor domain-containing protein [Leptodontidium sp. 2 PMI_412]|nr:fungal-specific transcription factor domain-containing protein [Leptodontidium sp. 2 PMI_412]